MADSKPVKAAPIEKTTPDEMKAVEMDSIEAKPQSQEIGEISLNSLKPFEKNTFKPYTGKKLAELIESIKEYGVLTPILVRHMPDNSDNSGYEIISGHNRVNAAKSAGLEVVPAVIKKLNDDEAIICMAESNFRQRQEILPSEKAFTYKFQLEAIKKQGKRNDLIECTTSCQVGTKLEAGEKVAKDNNDSKTQIHRYIRLTKLITELLDAVDNGEIKIAPAENISCLQEDKQKLLYTILTENEKKIKLSEAQSKKLKKASEGKKLDEKLMREILSDDKTTSHNIKEIAINELRTVFNNKINKYSFSKEDMQNIVKEVLKLCFEKK